METVIRGACRCEQVKFEVDPPLKFCAHCHCEDCRRAHGAPFVTWVGTVAERFRVVAGAESIKRYTSKAGATRSFCGVCGAMLFFESPRWAGEVHVARAQIPGDIEQGPQAHAYFDRRVPWLDHVDDLPKLGGPSGLKPL